MQLTCRSLAELEADPSLVFEQQRLGFNILDSTSRDILIDSTPSMRKCIFGQELTYIIINNKLNDLNYPFNRKYSTFIHKRMLTPESLAVFENAILKHKLKGTS